MARQDPFRGFRFLVEIDGLAGAGFMRAKGLSREVKHEVFHEGGVNDFEHKLVSQVSYPSLVLERGFFLDTLWDWTVAVANGEVERRMITIVLRDEAGGDKWSWQVEHAYPVKWSVSDMDANAAAVVVESVEFAHHGLRRGA